jgi:broad specificity phosphatase PhoE
MSAVSRASPSRAWGLALGAEADAATVAADLPPESDAAVWTSDEPKALETARAIAARRGLAVRVDHRFAEVDRPEVWDTDYRALAASYLDGSRLDGWEPRIAVAQRFSEAAAEALAGATADVVVVNHGLALTLFLAAQGACIEDEAAPFDAVAFWRALTFPDAWRLDMAGRRVRRVHTRGRLAPGA